MEGSYALSQVYEPIYRFFDGNEALISVVADNRTTAATGSFRCAKVACSSVSGIFTDINLGTCLRRRGVGFIYMSYIVLVGAFWIPGGLFLVVDVTGWPKSVAKYKVQLDKNVPVDLNQLKTALKTIAFNNIVLNLLSAYPMYVAQKSSGCTFSIEALPTFGVLVRDLLVIILVQEVIFYYSHRLFHHPYIYKAVHSKHHQWTAPIGIVAIYTTTVEYLTGNGLSVFVGPLLMRSHIVTFWIWYIIMNVATITHHSGYHLPLLMSPQAHDFHHLMFNWNFGTLGFLDWLHGTDKRFLGTINHQRHRILTSFKPIHEVFPTTTKGLRTQ